MKLPTINIIWKGALMIRFVWSRRSDSSWLSNMRGERVTVEWERERERERERKRWREMISSAETSYQKFIPASHWTKSSIISSNLFRGSSIDKILSRQKIIKSKFLWTVVVAQLAERSLPTPEICSSNPDISHKIFDRNYLATEIQKRWKKEKEAGNGPIKKVSFDIVCFVE